MDALRVDVWSDVACPWCWVGKRHLERAIAQFPHLVAVRWRAFELNPAAPPAVDPSVDYVERLARKYGATHAQAAAMIERMVQVGKAAGLDFRFDRVRPGNTFDAHRLLHWAHTQARQDALKERLFRAYMHEGQCVSDHSVLAQLAAEVGLDPEGAMTVLQSDDYTRAVRADEAEAMEIGVSGVPFFSVGGKYGVPGAQPPDVLLSVMRRAWDAAVEALDAQPAPSCDGDVCLPNAETGR